MEKEVERQMGEIPVEELCERYRQLYTPAIADTLRSRGLTKQILPNDIKPIRFDMKAAGPAFTVKGAPDPRPEGEFERRLEMLAAITPHVISVWDTSHDSLSAHWGGVMSTAAWQRGCRGAVVDGGVRDTARVIEMRFPVFARYRTPHGSLGTWRIVEYQVPIRIGDVLIRPNDFVCGDIDGVVIVPQEIVEEVLLEAESTRGRENKMLKALEEGSEVAKVSERYGIF